MISPLVVVAMLLAGAGALLPRVAFATPSLDACTGMLQREAGTATAINVTAPGTWCLDEDLVESVDVVDTYFTMIAVGADDVTIDCRGHRIEYTGSGAASMYGITTLGDRRRLTVRNCHLYGFSEAIVAYGDGFLFEDNTVHASRPGQSGPGSSIHGGGSGIIRRNRLYDSVGRAIYTQGSSLVLDNLIDGVVRTTPGQIHAIDVWPADGAEVRGNTVRGIESGPEFSQDMALFFDADPGTRRTLATDNVFVHDGSEGDSGVFCGGADVLVSDNVLSGFFSPTTFCTDVADNDISP